MLVEEEEEGRKGCCGINQGVVRRMKGLDLWIREMYLSGAV